MHANLTVTEAVRKAFPLQDSYSSMAHLKSPAQYRPVCILPNYPIRTKRDFCHDFSNAHSN